jgi:DNA-binding LytR/AlgR family response regulator
MPFHFEQKIKSIEVCSNLHIETKSHQYLKVKDLYIDFRDIIMIHALSNYSYIHTISMGRIMTSKTLKYWSSHMESDTFLRVHASFLINKKFISEINKKQKCVVMENGLTAKISRQINLKALMRMEQCKIA